jgi:hypothetical protein
MPSPGYERLACSLWNWFRCLRQSPPDKELPDRNRQVCRLPVLHNPARSQFSRMVARRRLAGAGETSDDGAVAHVRCLGSQTHSLADQTLVLSVRIAQCSDGCVYSLLLLPS